MRLSDLLGADVVDAAGDVVGQVTDVRLSQTGPVGAGVLAQFVVESLLVSPHHTGSLFGYERLHAQGPALLRAVVRRLHRHAFLVDVDAVRDWNLDDHRITLHADHRPRPPDAV
jgi:sporulation protein YlmC with PRC-barrel domain